MLSPLRVSIPEEPDEEINQEGNTSRTLVESSSLSTLEPLATAKSLAGANPTTKTTIQQPAPSFEVAVVEETDVDGSQEGRDFDRLFNTPPKRGANINTHSPEIFSSLEEQQQTLSSSLRPSASVSGKLKKVATVSPMSSSESNSAPTQKENSNDRYNFYAF